MGVVIGVLSVYYHKNLSPLHFLEQATYAIRHQRTYYSQNYGLHHISYTKRAADRAQRAS
ncbi:hypothetical protein [Sphingobacterium faecale]|uniref:Uncharacterized protein n=1 Tax=Sphingobacterium faecale TaxID=2803775 RepID=A0ABS1R176_9SPHI|nr:hypothetical protein [Sphingobacterium faecale]MBL1408225.1 hypothetical protein [Sphingobacterium faecale]